MKIEDNIDAVKSTVRVQNLQIRIGVHYLPKRCITLNRNTLMKQKKLQSIFSKSETIWHKRFFIHELCFLKLTI